jgi:outer membrane receptor protein involved in Fe transport
MIRNNIQINLSSQYDGNPNTFYYYTANASNGYNYGLNFDYLYDISGSFNGYLKIGLLETMINSYEYSIQNEIIQNPSRQGAHAPSYTYSFGFTKYYEQFNISASAVGKDSFYYDYSYDKKSKPYSTINTSIGYTVNKNIDLSVWAKNILNTKYTVRGFYFSLKPIDLNENGNYYDDDNSELYKSYGEPLTIGVSLKYNI